MAYRRRETPRILRRGFLGSMFTLALCPLWRTYIRTLKSILYNFFYLQYKAALFPKKARISQVDHPLDEEIPFTPSWVNVYMDFSPFWVRTQAFLAKTFGKAAYPHIDSFIRGIGELYAFASVVYSRNFSTTRRPVYIGKPGFISIHMFDPHLMCIPSLHVMVVVMTYTRLWQVLEILDSKKEFASELQSIRRHALDITESILYVKQHSINCIAAALYAMTRFDGQLFPESEARDFVNSLFIENGPVSESARQAIKKHITGLYDSFIVAGENSENWEQPLLDFLASYAGEASS